MEEYADGCNNCLCYTCKHNVPLGDCCMANKKARPKTGCPIVLCADYENKEETK